MVIVYVDEDDDDVPEEDDELCIQKCQSQYQQHGKQKRPAAASHDQALAFALR